MVIKSLSVAQLQLFDWVARFFIFFVILRQILCLGDCFFWQKLKRKLYSYCK